MAFTKINAAGIGTTETVTVDGLTVINDGSFGGNLSVGGTITYEDVTNVDSVGLITARNGIVVGSGITLSKDGDIFATGVTTTGSLVSSGAISGTTGNFSSNVDIAGELTVAETIAHTGDTNNKISFPSADTITLTTSGSERARIDSSGRVRIGCTAQPSTTVSGSQFDAGGKTLRISEGGGTSSTTGASVQITGGGGNTSIGAAAAIGAVLSLTNCNNTDNNQTSIDFSASSGLAVAKVIGKNDSHSSRNGSLIFATSSAAAPAERARIDSSGRLLVGTTVAPSDTDTKLRVHFSQNTGSGRAIEISHDTNGADKVGAAFGLAIANGGESTNAADLTFQTASGGSLYERLRIDSSGNVLIGDSAGQIGKLSTLGTGNHISAIRHSSDTSSANFLFAKYRGSRSSPAIIVNGDTLGDLAWYGYNGSSIIKAASISASADSTVDASNMPTKLVFKTTSGNTNRSVMEISNHGHVRKPNQPYFHVYGAGGATAYNQNTVVVLTQVSVNTGSNYNTSNGRFTVPAGAAGIYMFTFQFFPNAADTFRVALRRNGTNQTNGYISGHNGNMGAGYSVASGCMMLSLSEADYVDIVIANGDMSNTYNGHTGFQGYFLG